MKLTSRSLFIVLSLLTLTLFFSNLKVVNAIDTSSNQSLESKILVDAAEKCVQEMEMVNISVKRVNELLTQAKQLYSAQLSLEQNNGNANYKIVNQTALEVCTIKNTALKAYDELSLFNQSYNSAAQDFNLSSMQSEYDAVITSFNDERFEDTSDLIDKAYQKLSEVQTSQTTVKLFYQTTTRSIKQFFTNYWKTILIWIAVLCILLIIFWKTIKKQLLRRKLKRLKLRKIALEKLIKEIQFNYFEKKTISEAEYRVKLETFKLMVRDVNSEIPKINETLAKVDMDRLEKLNTKNAKVYKKQ